MVLATAIRSRAVKASLVMIALSSRMLAKMIMISTMVCSSRPIRLAWPGRQFRMRPAARMRIGLALERVRSKMPAEKR